MMRFPMPKGSRKRSRVIKIVINVTSRNDHRQEVLSLPPSKAFIRPLLAFSKVCARGCGFLPLIIFLQYLHRMAVSDISLRQ